MLLGQIGNANIASVTLTGPDGKAIPAQLTKPGLIPEDGSELHFLLPHLPPGESVRLKATLSTESPAETVELARRIGRGPLSYRGVMGYEGHAVLVPDREKRERIAREALTELSRHVATLREAGLAPQIVSAGGTGTYDISGAWPDVT